MVWATRARPHVHVFSRSGPLPHTARTKHRSARQAYMLLTGRRALGCALSAVIHAPKALSTSFVAQLARGPPLRRRLFFVSLASLRRRRNGPPCVLKASTTRTSWPKAVMVSVAPGANGLSVALTRRASWARAATARVWRTVMLPSCGARRSASRLGLRVDVKTPSVIASTFLSIAAGIGFVNFATSRPDVVPKFLAFVMRLRLAPWGGPLRLRLPGRRPARPPANRFSSTCLVPLLEAPPRLNTARLMPIWAFPLPLSLVRTASPATTTVLTRTTLLQTLVPPPAVLLAPRSLHIR